jgi:hypothetical protein
MAFDEKFRSRKFLITLISILGTFMLAAFGKMTPDVATVLAIGVGAYNLANGYVTGKGNERINN